jgi:Mn2+/Fe2+ NRAMP family transporter
MQVLNGIITPIVLGLILLLANRRSLLGAAANTPTYRRIATVCVATIAIMATIVATQALIGLA